MSGVHTIDAIFDVLLAVRVEDLPLSPDVDDSPYLLLDLDRCAFVGSSCSFGDDLKICEQKLGVFWWSSLPAGTQPRIHSCGEP